MYQEKFGANMSNFRHCGGYDCPWATKCYRCMAGGVEDGDEFVREAWGDDGCDWYIPVDKKKRKKRDA